MKEFYEAQIMSKLEERFEIVAKETQTLENLEDHQFKALKISLCNVKKMLSKQLMFLIALK